MAGGISSNATNIPNMDDTEDEITLNSVKPTYLQGVWKDEGVKSNWFINIQGGMNAFVGNPVGHGDFFDRTAPMLHLDVGKWITPTVGLRMSWQGVKLVDSDMEKRSFNNIHADFLYNLSNAFKKDYSILTKWNFIPNIGLGIITNSHTKKKNFAVSYGIDVQCKLNERYAITAGIANTTTWSDFDGNGDPDKFGDNLMQFKLGLTIGIGKQGWKKVLDPKPFIINNEIKQEKSVVKNRIVDNLSYFPKNNYSGLNSLRARMNGEKEETLKGIYYPSQMEEIDSATTALIGNPVYFFFSKGSAKLKDRRQLVNIREIAKASKKYGLTIQVIGSADSQTGTKKINKRLSKRRAETLAKELRKQGVSSSLIKKKHLGGVKKFSNIKNNRNTCVILSSPAQQEQQREQREEEISEE